MRSFFEPSYKSLIHSPNRRFGGIACLSLTAIALLEPTPTGMCNFVGELVF
jgi:hypothetical protein